MSNKIKRSFYKDIQLDMPIFREHFPGDPIYPGSFIINDILLYIKETLSVKNVNSITLKSIKFRRFIKPNIRLLFSMYMLSENETLNIKFNVRENKKFSLVSNGYIIIKEKIGEANE